MTPSHLALVRDALEQASEALDHYADAEAVGDPSEYVANDAMSAREVVEKALAVLPARQTP